ncbi:MAG: carboxymuconolactone decarboxylase family protein [Nocardioides sp.]
MTRPTGPGSAERLPRLRPDELTPSQRAVYDHITSGPRASGTRLFEMVDGEGRLNGPFDAMLRAPALGEALQSLGSAVRYGTSLTGRIREMAILAVAAHWRSGFETYAHEAVGRAVGLSEEELAHLRSDPGWRPAERGERAALDLVRGLLATGDVDDGAWAALGEDLDPAQIFELTTLVGYYGLLALQMRVFRADQADGVS